MTDAIVSAPAATKKVIEKAATTIAETNIAPHVAEVTEVALQVPSKFVVSSKLLLGVGAGVALGIGGFYGFQKVRAIRATKKAELTVPATVEEAELLP